MIPIGGTEKTGERSVLLRADEVGLLFTEGRVQLRRPVIPRFNDGAFLLLETSDGGFWPHRSRDGESLHPYGEEIPYPSPFGEVGGLLWGRETWLPLARDHWEDRSRPRDWLHGYHDRPRRNGVAYRADTRPEGEEVRRGYGYRWRPSVHMPRWASRVSARLVGLRCENPSGTDRWVWVADCAGGEDV